MKIESFYNKKEKKQQYRARFQINKKEFYPSADTRGELKELIDEIKVQERRGKRGIIAVESTASPTVNELFDLTLPTIKTAHHKTFCKRVFKDFLALLPREIKVTELKKRHFQKYIDWRAPQKGVQTGKQIKLDTVYKELHAARGALSAADRLFDELEEWTPPHLPKRGEKKKSRSQSRRRRIVSKDRELTLLLEHLRKPPEGKQTGYHYFCRVRLADDLEFRYETGLRRKEVARLEKKNYFPAENALREVVRWKTETVTVFYPLTARAKEIIESRLNLQKGSEFIFTKDGNPVESVYRTLKKACELLKIRYGRYLDDGFVPHDLRHNFATEIIPNTDIETARELLGHSNISQTGDYLHTDETRLRDAMRKREGVDKKTQLTVIYRQIRRRKMKLKKFLDAMKNVA